MVTIAAVLSVFALGTIGFHYLLHEPWHSAFYRTVVTATLTGLDSKPRGIGAELLTIGLVLSGVTIFGYVAAQVVDSIAHGILGGAWKEKRRRTMIDRLSDHIVICGYGRVGRRIADELRTGEIPYVVLDFSDDAVAAAAERDDLFIQGTGTEDEDASASRRSRCAPSAARAGRRSASSTSSSGPARTSSPSARRTGASTRGRRRTPSSRQAT